MPFDFAFLERDTDQLLPYVGHIAPDQVLLKDGSVLSRDAPVARIFYWRTVQMDGAPPQKTHWTATLGYRVNEPVSGSSRLYNPEGIVVTSYSVQEDSPK